MAERKTGTNGSQTTSSPNQGHERRPSLDSADGVALIFFKPFPLRATIFPLNPNSLSGTDASGELPFLIVCMWKLREETYKIRFTPSEQEQSLRRLAAAGLRESPFTRRKHRLRSSPVPSRAFFARLRPNHIPLLRRRYRRPASPSMVSGGHKIGSMLEQSSPYFRAVRQHP